VALLAFFRMAALPVIGPFAGVVADRVDRLALVRACQAINVLAPGIICLLLLTGQIAAWHLFVSGLLLGLSWAIDWPSRRALMVDLAGASALVPATVLDNLSMNGSRIVGPALAGLLLSLSGPLAGYVLLTLAAVAGAVLLLPVRRPAGGRALVTGSPLRNLAAGLAYAGRDPVILGTLLITIIMNCLVFPSTQLLPVVARDALHVGPVELGWLAAADSIGSLLGLPLILRLRRGGPYGWVYIVGSAFMGLTTLLFAFSPWYAPALLLLIIGGIGHAAFGTMQGTILLSQTGPEMRGRAMGVLTLAIGASPFGSLLLGLMAEAWGVSVAIGAAAAVATVTVILVGLLTPSLRRAGMAQVPAPVT
jgi:MFS family permease